MAPADSFDPSIFATDYDAIAPHYSKLRTARYYDQEIIDAVPRHATAVLDIGCGDGTLALKLADSNRSARRVIGVDPSEEMIALARRRLEKRNEELSKQPPPSKRLKVTFYHGFAEALPPEVAQPNSYDAIIAVRVMHHCEDHYAVMRDLYSLLAPGGKMIVLDLNATGEAAVGKRQQWLLRLYKVSVYTKHLIRLQHSAARRDLRREYVLYRSAPWQQHFGHEPNFHWTMLERAMQNVGLRPRKKRRNWRFIRLIGQRSDHARPQAHWLRRCLAFYLCGLTTSLPLAEGVPYWLARIGALFVLATIFGGMGLGLGWMLWKLDPQPGSLREWTVFLLAGVQELADWINGPGLAIVATLSVGAVVGSVLTRMYLRAGWRRGPVEDRPGWSQRAVAWLMKMLKLRGALGSHGFWLYYRGHTNCRAVERLEDCHQFLEEHFADVEGQIWIYRSDLRGLIEQEAFTKLYRNVVDTEYRIEEVRIILDKKVLGALHDEVRRQLQDNLEKMYRRSIIKYRDLSLDDLGSAKDTPSVLREDRELLEEFRTYTSDETFIFYTQGAELPRRQAICVNRCAVESQRDHAQPLRIVVAGMRNWPDRERGLRVDLEPLEKYMSVDIQRVFQGLFTDGKWNSLYSALRTPAQPAQGNDGG